MKQFLKLVLLVQIIITFAVILGFAISGFMDGDWPGLRYAINVYLGITVLVLFISSIIVFGLDRLTDWIDNLWQD